MTPKSRAEHIARIRRRRRLIRAGIAHREGMMRRAAAFALCSALMAACPWGKAAISAQAGESCTAGMVMPVQGSEIVARFDGPYQAWMAGHRGIDIRAQKGDELIAPATGIISHAGTVAGKSTVSIRVRSFTLTFEPAQTALSVGTPVLRGKPFAKVAGGSDHCDDACVHWGIKRGKGAYEDPERWLTPQSIRLVPVA